MYSGPDDYEPGESDIIWDLNGDGGTIDDETGRSQPEAPEIITTEQLPMQPVTPDSVDDGPGYWQEHHSDRDDDTSPLSPRWHQE